MQTNDPVNFSLFAQNRDNSIVIKNHQQDNYIQTTAPKALANSTLVNSLSARDIKILRCIAESQPKSRRAV